MARITRHDSHISLTRYSDSPRKGKKLHNNLQNYDNQNMNKTSMKRVQRQHFLFKTASTNTQPRFQGPHLGTGRREPWERGSQVE